LHRRTEVPNLMPLLRNGTLLIDYIGWAGLAGGQPDWHAEQVVQAWRRRQLRSLGTRLSQLAEAADDGADPGDVVEHAMNSLIAAQDTVGEPRWDPPIPLSACRVLPRFPTDALPAWVGEQVAGVAEFTQTPPDLAGSVALAALSAAAGGRARVQIRPGWVEPTNLVHRRRDAPRVAEVRGVRRDDRTTAGRRADPHRARHPADHRRRPRAAHRLP